MKIHRPKFGESRRPCWRIGPGTIVAVVTAAAVFAWQTRARTATDGLGRVTYEADANGRLQPIRSATTPITSSRTAPSLWKPEVNLLLDHSHALQLSRFQIKSIQRIDADWLAVKTALQKKMGTATGDTNTLLTNSSEQHRAPLASVTRGLADYSALSHEFNDCRTEYWNRSVKVLTSEQRLQLDGIRTSVGRKR